jgi:hypothetical protein
MASSLEFVMLITGFGYILPINYMQLQFPFKRRIQEECGNLTYYRFVSGNLWAFCRKVLKELMRNADKALYRGKMEGKDKTVLWGR